MFLGFGFKNPPFFLLKTVDNEKCMLLPSSWLMLYIVEWQFCCSSEGPKGLGHEYCADWFTRHTAHHLRAWLIWYVPWLVRVFQHLPKNVWPSARGPSILKAQKEVCISCSSHYSILLVYIPVRLISSSLLMWLVQQENNNELLSLTSFFDMYK